MIATLHRKSIVLKVGITYDTKSYRIKHKESSPNMQFAWDKHPSKIQ